jgi:hypothetical protein
MTIVLDIYNPATMKFTDPSQRSIILRSLGNLVEAGSATISIDYGGISSPLEVFLNTSLKTTILASQNDTLIDVKSFSFSRVNDLIWFDFGYSSLDCGAGVDTISFAKIN